MKRIIHCFIILALALAAVSPACEFISGQNVIEICTSDGIKRIALPGEPADEGHEYAKQDCAFCFAQTHLKLAQAEPVKFNPQTTARIRVSNPVPYAVDAFERSAFEATGPPSSFLI